MMTPAEITMLQFMLSKGGFGSTGKKIMTKANVTKHNANPLIRKPSGFENFKYDGGSGSGLLRRNIIVTIVEPYERSSPTRLIEMMLLKAIVEPAAIQDRQNVTINVTMREFTGRPLLGLTCTKLVRS